MDPGRVFHLTKIKTAFGFSYCIFDSDETTRLYSIEITEPSKPQLTVTRHQWPFQHQPPMQNPLPPPPPYGSFFPLQMPFKRADPGVIVGTASFHDLSSKIDISLQSGPQPMDMTMKRPDPLASGRKFDSPLGKLQWKEESILKSNQKLVDQHRRVIARYEKCSSSLSRKKMDRFILLVQDPAVIANFDMIVVTGLATIEYNRQSDEDWDEVGKEWLYGVLGI